MKKITHTLLFVAILAANSPNAYARLKAASGSDVKHFIEKNFPDLRSVRVHPSELNSKKWTVWTQKDYSVTRLSSKDRKVSISWWTTARTEKSEATTLNLVNKIHKEIVSVFRNVPNKILIKHTEMLKAEEPNESSPAHRADLHIWNSR